MTRHDLRETVQVMTARGPEEVPANVKDGLAIHPWLDVYGLAESEYAVTHAATGLRITERPVGIKAAVRVRETAAGLMDWTRTEKDAIEAEAIERNVRMAIWEVTQ